VHRAERERRDGHVVPSLGEPTRVLRLGQTLYEVEHGFHEIDHAQEGSGNGR